MTVFSNNMKKYRQQKSLTQEQVAELLKINPQTVSRWECGTTLPDVLLLPEIARLYAVTIDDLFRTNNKAYRNYADRLATIYEKTGSVDDFYNAEAEFRKMIKSGNMDTWDQWHYAVLLDEMAEYCSEHALRWYEKVLANGAKEETFVYGRAKSLRAGLLIRMGQGDAVVKEQEELVKKDPKNAKEIGFLMEFYCRTKQYEKELKLFEKTKKQGVEDWTIYYFAADANRSCKNYAQAIELYQKCGALGTDFHDELEGLAICYEEMGEKEKAYASYMELAEVLRKEGYDEDAAMYEQKADEMKR